MEDGEIDGEIGERCGERRVEEKVSRTDKDGGWRLQVSVIPVTGGRSLWSVVVWFKVTDRRAG